MRVAVIGIGSNSMRLLVADIEERKRVLSDRISTRLFLSLDARGLIPKEAAEHLAACVDKLAERAREAGAQAIHAFSTSAMRDAINRRQVCQTIFLKTGLRVEIVDGQREAELSFLGATCGARSAVIDIGGGSTEIIAGGDGKVDASVSLQLGASRLMRARSIMDDREARVVIAYCRNMIKSDPACARVMQAAAGCDAWVGVGGTMTSLASLSLGVDWNRTDAVHGASFTADDAQVLIAHLSVLTPKERMAIVGMQPQRADIIVHGLCILYAVMHEYRVSNVVVSLNSNLDGYLKALYGVREAFQ